ncbi:MAG TPA: sensor domain-containing diguanylate cyclase [Actinomycetes bacterium]|nr:sensor domain-containing diguanylate cyclase [Actinomycetes bacterium]
MGARLGALADIARAAWAGSRADLLRQVSVAAHQALRVSSLSISQWEPEHGRIRVLINHGDLAASESAEPVDELYSVETFTYLRDLVDELQGWVINSETADPDEPDVQLLAELGKHCSVGVPIPLEGRVWGELYLTRTSEQPCFDQSDLDLALVVAAQIGAALATAEHLDRIDQLAHTDPLTGLANRRAVDEVLDSAFARHLAEGIPVSLIVCDLNGLKRINDDQGHEAGDRALVRFAAMLSSVAGRLPGSIASRLGGDEFCIVVPEAKADDVVAAADELCRLVLRSPLEGVSCGVASTADDVGDVDTAGRLFRLADAAQYRAKRSHAAVPVVAGRSLPEGVAEKLSQYGPITTGDRRLFRGRELSDSARLVRSGIELLDETRGEATQARLASVADLLAQRSDALGWWLSIVRPGSDSVVTRQFALYRQRPEEPLSPHAPVLGTEYLLEDYPATGALLNGGVLVVNGGDSDADPAEVAILDGMGAVSVAMGGCRDTRGAAWLIEIYGDALSQSMGEISLPMRTLMAIAVHEAGLV